ncbi:MAG: hypothetical protein JW729_05735 [Bacteroidales bacterium]|nr:hypothetical protein [Bacteroidales bacterium]
MASGIYHPTQKIFVQLNLLFDWFTFPFAFLFAAKAPGHYSTLGRLYRIYRFLRRSSRKRKQEKKQEKKNKKDEKRKEKRFKRRLLWRKLKVIFRSIFLGKKSQAAIQLKKEKAAQKAWAVRRQKRIRKVILKSLFKPKKKSKVRLLLQKKKRDEKRFVRYRRHRIYKYVLKKSIKIWFDFLRGKGWPKRKKKKESVLRMVFRRDYLLIALNSLMFFLLAYFIISFIEKLGMAFTAMHFDYQTVLYYYRVEYLVDADAWYADSVKAIFASGPVLALIVATLVLILYSKVYLEDGVLKLLLLWGVFHGFNSILGGALIGALTGKEFGYTIMYLYYTDTGKLIISLLMILLMIVLGSSSVKFWIFTGNTYFNFSTPAKRQPFIVSQVLIPYVVGNLLIFLINQPKQTGYYVLVNLSLIFMVLPVLLLSRYHQEYYFDEKPKKIKLSISTLFVAIFLIALYRIGLDYGLRLG